MQPMLDSLEKTAKTLNETADYYNQLIEAANERLEAIGLGIPFWWEDRSFCPGPTEEVPIDPDDLSSKRRKEWTDHSLGFDKINGKWQLGIRWERWAEVVNPYHGNLENELIEYVISPLLSSSRQLRLATGPKLAEFLESLNAEFTELGKGPEKE